MTTKRRIGIIGYGHLGQYLTEIVSDKPELELAFIWNRSQDALKDLPDSLVCRDLQDCGRYKPDLIVEVAHPDITKKYGRDLLSVAPYFIGSPTALADTEVEDGLRELANAGPHGLYIPCGAFWGTKDIEKLSEFNSLEGLKVTMKKHPSSFKLNSPLKELNDSVLNDAVNAVTIYEGPVRPLCSMAPNNVNTMAVAALVAKHLGFDKVQGCLVSDPMLKDSHIVEVDVEGRNGFRVKTERINPANRGAVTGSTTFLSFAASLCNAAKSTGPGVHFC